MPLQHRHNSAFESFRAHLLLAVLIPLFCTMANAAFASPLDSNWVTNSGERRGTTREISTGTLTLAATPGTLSATLSLTSRSPKPNIVNTAVTQSGAPTTGTSASSAQIAADDKRVHTLNGLFIGLITLISLLIVCFIALALWKYCRQRRKAKDREGGGDKGEMVGAEDQGQERDMTGVVTVDSHLDRPGLSLPRPPTTHATFSNVEEGPRWKAEGAPHHLTLPRWERKPTPLDLGPSRGPAIPSIAITPAEPATSTPKLEAAPATGFSPALEDARKRLEQQQRISRTTPLSPHSPSSDANTPSIRFALATSSRTFRGQSSYSPPITAVAEPAESGEETGARHSLAKHPQSHGKGSRPAKPTRSPKREPGPLDQTQLPSENLPQDAPLHLQSAIIDEPSASTWPQRSSFGVPISASSPEAKSSRMSSQAPSYDGTDESPPLPPTITPLPLKRNSFGVNDVKGEENEPSSAPAIVAVDKLIEQQTQFGLSSAFSDADSRSQSTQEAASRASSRNSSSSGGHQRAQVCTIAQAHKHRNSPRPSPPKSPLSQPATTSSSRSASTLSLQSSMARAQRWLGGPESPTTPMGYSLA